MHRSAARTRRRPNAKYCAVERCRANGDDDSRSAIRIAAGRRSGRSTTCVRSRCVKSAVAAARARCDIPAAGLGSMQAPTRCPWASSIRIHKAEPVTSAPAVANSVRFTHTGEGLGVAVGRPGRRVRDRRPVEAPRSRRAYQRACSDPHPRTRLDQPPASPTGHRPSR
jgi:hypothetical protein